jgi:Arc/MetJ family transcription regulator
MCKEQHIATNLALDPDLVERALKVSGEKTKKAAVSRALEEFVTRRSQKRLVDLMAKLEWDESFNYKAERSRR